MLFEGHVAIKNHLESYATSYGNEIHGSIETERCFVQLFASEISMRGHLTQEW